MTLEAAGLLTALMLAHFLGDFSILANARIIESKATGGPVLTIALHAAIHGLLTAPVLFAFSGSPNASLVATSGIVVTHFAIDLVRSRLGLRFPALTDVTRKPYWTALGFDQFLHGLILIWAAMTVL